MKTNNSRTRAWRRFKKHINNGRGMGSDRYWKPEKKWKFLYTRPCKIARAKQLGIDYPRVNLRHKVNDELDNE